MSFRVKQPTSVFSIGPHSLLQRNGIIFNDRSQLECYWVDDFTGFERPDIRVTDEENPQDHGSTPGPSFYGSRTMTMGGFIRCGSYPVLMEMDSALVDSLVDLATHSMLIKAKDRTDPESYITHPDMQIACRPVDWQIAKQIDADDTKGFLRRNFTLALRASNPFYTSLARKSVEIEPEVITTLGRVYDRFYDLVYDTPMDEFGNPVPPGGSVNSAEAVNEGNWDASPILRFHGAMTNPFLTNNTNGHVIRLEGQIDTGDYIEVNVETGDIIDAIGVSRYAQWDSTSDWLRLVGKRGTMTGVNHLTLGVTDFSAGARCEIEWRDTAAG
jgi:hypothetical protein